MGPPERRGSDWFTEIYSAHYPHLVRYGQRRLADLDASAELAQEVFVIAWRRRLDVPDPPLPWLYGVARRVLANGWRARTATPPIVPIEDAGELSEKGWRSPDGVASVADLLAALGSLSDTDQEILRLIGWEELTLAEAAHVLGSTRAAAAVRLHRARKRLTAALNRSEPTSASKAATPISAPKAIRTYGQLTTTSRGDT